MFNSLFRSLFDVRHSVLPRIWGSVLILVLASGLASVQPVDAIVVPGNNSLANNAGNIPSNQPAILTVMSTDGSAPLATRSNVGGDFRLVSSTDASPDATIRAGARGTDASANLNAPAQDKDAATAFKTVMLALSAGFAMLMISVAVVIKPQA